MTQFLAERHSHSVHRGTTALPHPRFAEITASYPHAVLEIWCACRYCGYHVGATYSGEYNRPLSDDEIQAIHTRLLDAFPERPCVRPVRGEFPGESFGHDGGRPGKALGDQWAKIPVAPPQPAPIGPLLARVGMRKSASPTGSRALEDAVPDPGIRCAGCGAAFGFGDFVQSADVWPPRWRCEPECS